MPRSATVRRPTPVVAVLPAAQPTVDEPPAAGRPGGGNVIQLHPSPIFRVGDYEVGDGYCSRLHGHPDIRY